MATYSKGDPLPEQSQAHGWSEPQHVNGVNTFFTRNCTPSSVHRLWVVVCTCQSQSGSQCFRMLHPSRLAGRLHSLGSFIVKRVKGFVNMVLRIPVQIWKLREQCYHKHQRTPLNGRILCYVCPPCDFTRTLLAVTSNKVRGLVMPEDTVAWLLKL